MVFANFMDSWLYMEDRHHGFTSQVMLVVLSLLLIGKVQCFFFLMNIWLKFIETVRVKNIGGGGP